MKHYESYKASGIEWLDEIPSHWKVEKLKHIASYNDDVLLEDTPANQSINYVEISDVDSVSGIKGYTTYLFKDAPSRARRCTKKNDIIVSTVRTYLKAIAPVLQDNLIVSTGFAVIRPQKVHPAFLTYSLLNEGFIGEVISKSVGVSYPAINASDLVEIKIPIPPIPEQQAIASYLESKVSQIDSTIAEKEAMVQDLQNYRKSIISETVTRGTNPKVPMKDSGIDWLEKIPSHWKTVSFKRMFSFGRGLPITKANLVEQGLPVISYGQIHSKRNPGTRIEEHLIRYVPESYSKGNDASLVKCGDLLFADTSEDLDGCGNCVYVDKDMVLYAGYHTIIAKTKEEEPSNYIAYLFKTDCWRSQLRASVSGVKVYSITQSVLGETTILVPPLSEQHTITSYLDDKTAKIDFSISELQLQIEDLKSYKSSLITEAVTGKIDLR